jgi:hypothetical protein
VHCPLEAVSAQNQASCWRETPISLRGSDWCPERSTAAEFLQTVEQIRAEFPEVRPWLAWWILPGNGSMIFPAMQKMPADLPTKLPNSTNASESNHWLLYRAVGYGFDLWEGIRRLYRFQRETEMLYAAIIGMGVSACLVLRGLSISI